MNLPIRTTIKDIEVFCRYLATKPTGATISEAKAVLDSKVLDNRKISAFRFWGLIEGNGEKMRLTDAGQRLAKDKFAKRAEVLKKVVAQIQPYAAIVERVVSRGESIITATEVGSHWHQHFPDLVSDKDKTLNDQAVCFFQLAESADLGKLTIGRRDQPTRFNFSEDNARRFVEGVDISPSDMTGGESNSEDDYSPPEANGSDSVQPLPSEESIPKEGVRKGNRVFITHGKNNKILEQVKEIVAFGKLEPVIAQERETAAKPVPEKVMDEMRNCNAAVIHVGSEGFLKDIDGNEIPQINGNVLIEIGAAMALYRRNFILLVEEGLKLPSNLQGLYECRYQGDELSGEATMKLLKAFNAFD